VIFLRIRCDDTNAAVHPKSNLQYDRDDCDGLVDVLIPAQPVNLPGTPMETETDMVQDPQSSPVFNRLVPQPQ
jgi:hypothetical protein